MELFQAIRYYQDYHKVNSGKKYDKGVWQHARQVFRPFWRY